MKKSILYLSSLVIISLFMNSAGINAGDKSYKQDSNYQQGKTDLKTQKAQQKTDAKNNYKANKQNMSKKKAQKQKKTDKKAAQKNYKANKKTLRNQTRGQ